MTSGDDPKHNLDIACSEEVVEQIAAHLNGWEVNGVEYTESGLTVYGREGFDPFSFLHFLDRDTPLRWDSYHVFSIKKQNWNRVWESHFDPVEIGDFCTVYAPFHKIRPTTLYSVLIDPEMAFGTGHHATTEMMIRHLEEMDISGLSVLDVGCGTGILALLCARMGAGMVAGLDIEAEAIENAKKNATLNGIRDIRWYQSELADLPPGRFDQIMANINLNVLTGIATHLSGRANPGAHLCTSGYLAADRDAFLSVFRYDWALEVEKEQQGWLSHRFVKRAN